MNHTVTLDRRGFLAAAGTFTLGFALDLGGPAGQAQAQTAGAAVNSWLTIDSANRITLTIGSSDMGQGSFAGLAQILSEDLMVDYASLRLVQGGPTLANPAPVGSAIMTGGSGVTRNNYIAMRQAGASARETLVAAAMALNPGSSRASFSVAKGIVYFNGAAAYTYGQLAATAATLAPVAVTTAHWVPDAQLQVIGQSVPRLDIPAKVYGTAQYGLDVRLPGMVYAVIQHCPTVGGTLASTPAKPASALALVPVKVVAGTGRAAEAVGNVNALAVVAGTTWDAMQAARAVKPVWTLPAAASSWNSAQFLADAKALATAATPAGLYTVESSGASAASAVAASARQVDVTYTLPFVPHGCMEVLNCTVDYQPGVGCTVYAPTQGSKSVLQLVMTLTGLSEAQVRIQTTLLGGGLGRKIELDYVAQAVQVGMALARPVQLVWPREQDFTHGQYRPMGVIRARAGLDAGGGLTGLVYRNVSPSIGAQRGRAIPATGDSSAYEGAHALPYGFPSRLVEWVNQPTPIPVGYWRSVGASLNTFAVESLMDELAAASGQDPYAFRKRFLGTNARWMAVLDAAAALGSWSTAAPAGSARGIAIGAAFNSIVACVVEVSGVTKDTAGNLTGVKIAKVSVALDSYLTINPKNVEAQITGGVVHGINATLYGQQTFSNGAAQRANFNTNPVIRLSAMPAVAVTILPAVSYQPASAGLIGGVGELGVPTVAPALANAIFRLTGQRKRDLPLLPAATMGGL